MAPVTAVQRHQSERRWRRRLMGLLLVLILLFGIVPVTLGIVVLVRFSGSATPYYADDLEHFKYGSIGAETASGLPYWLWQALPRLFPDAFEGRQDYSAFGFHYELDAAGAQRDLPVGISRRERSGMELVWFNCAVCHTGAYEDPASGERMLVAGMPASQLDLHRFVDFLLGLADDPRLAPEAVLQAIDETGGNLDWIDRLAWQYFVMPQVREQLIVRNAALRELLDNQPAWGRGRVDTFNPYKLLQLGHSYDSLDAGELSGASDFPSIFLQGPREGMQLHWDGNNDSLQERNLSAALGAGVTPETVDIESINRVAAWLQDLQSPAYPGSRNETAAASGCETYMSICADCHGYRGAEGYVFEGERLGTVEPIARVGTSPARLDSYTEEFSIEQRGFFAGTPYQFKHFRKTDGYANAPLDGLWLRGPYLHNGSVPTLAALLTPPEERPVTFERGGIKLDQENGGFIAAPCGENIGNANELTCYDTRISGNSNSGHTWGTQIDSDKKKQLIDCLLNF